VGQQAQAEAEAAAAVVAVVATISTRVYIGCRYPPVSVRFSSLAGVSRLVVSAWGDGWLHSV
jgi:hypothetical protein